ncbi:sensor histidine kinase [Paracoccus sp. p4-l81]|uniref:sensor histidine kinase n=1 Tax=Paracoccus sp. p4-l81 TaxID=3342806 RepID=UPI0035B751D1
MSMIRLPFRSDRPAGRLPGAGLPGAAAILPAPRRDRLLMLPVAALVAVVVLVGLLLSLVARDRAAEARQKLTTDALWVEQYLRFQLSTYERELEGVAHDIARGDGAAIMASAGALMVDTHPEVQGLVLADAAGRAIMSDVPGQVGAAPPGLDDLARAASRSLAPVHAAPRRDPGGLWVADIGVATGDGRVLAMTVGLADLLAQNVPWWIAGRYHVALTDTGGAVIAARSSIPAPEGAAAHTMSFDPPLPGTFVRLTAFDSRTGIGPMALIAAILGLLVLVAVSLAAVARQSRHRAAAEHGLRAEHAFRKAMEESLTIGMRARARDGTVIYVNPEFCRMVGRPEDQIVGLKPPHAYWAPEVADEGMARHRSLIDSGPVPRRFETRFQRPDGSRVDALVYEAPLIGPDGAHLGWMGSVVDITDRKLAEVQRAQEAERLQHAARLVTLGEMASTLAHELNQPLAAIAGYAAGSRNLLAAGADSADLAPVLEKLEGQAARAGAILHRVQDFARKRTSQRVPVDLAAVVATALHFIEDEARTRGVPVRADLPGQPLLLLADPVLIEQAVINLVRNALDALAATPPEARDILVQVTAGADMARITVADTGPGIAPARVADLFAPFQTTKPEGMGLGLSICRSILESHGGRLTYAPRPGGGSLFDMTLPLAAPGPRGLAVASGEASQGDATIGAAPHAAADTARDPDRRAEARITRRASLPQDGDSCVGGGDGARGICGGRGVAPRAENWDGSARSGVVAEAGGRDMPGRRRLAARPWVWDACGSRGAEVGPEGRDGLGRRGRTAGPDDLQIRDRRGLTARAGVCGTFGRRGLLPWTAERDTCGRCGLVAEGGFLDIRGTRALEVGAEERDVFGRCAVAFKRGARDTRRTRRLEVRPGICDTCSSRGRPAWAADRNGPDRQGLAAGPEHRDICGSRGRAAWTGDRNGRDRRGLTAGPEHRDICGSRGPAAWAGVSGTCGRRVLAVRQGIWATCARRGRAPWAGDRGRRIRRGLATRQGERDTCGRSGWTGPATDQGGRARCRRGAVPSLTMVTLPRRHVPSLPKIRQDAGAR